MISSVKMRDCGGVVNSAKNVSSELWMMLRRPQCVVNPLGADSVPAQRGEDSLLEVCRRAKVVVVAPIESLDDGVGMFFVLLQL